MQEMRQPLPFPHKARRPGYGPAALAGKGRGCLYFREAASQAAMLAAWISDFYAADMCAPSRAFFLRYR